MLGLGLALGMERRHGGRGAQARRHKREVGDTLIEVLFAVTVFSLVVVMSLALMNQGLNASVRSLQITLVRQEIDGQAETLRFLNSAYVEAYQSGFTPAANTPAAYYKALTTGIDTAKTSVSKFATSAATCPAAPSGSFIVSARTGAYQKNTSTNSSAATTFSQVEYNPTSGAVSAARGIWIEAVKSASTNGTAYVDYHIRTCWFPPGSGQSMNLGTIVRLYEPTN